MLQAEGEEEKAVVASAVEQLETDSEVARAAVGMEAGSKGAETHGECLLFLTDRVTYQELPQN